MPRVIPEYKEQAKKKILETAAEVFARKGYHEATMDDIASAIGVSKGAVYQYFETKEKLFQELCLLKAGLLEEALRSGFTGGGFRKVAEEHMDAELERHARERALMFEALAEAPRNPALQKLVEETYERYVEIIARFIDRLKEEGEIDGGVDSTAIARVVVALRHGVIVSFLQGLGAREAKKVWKDGLNSLIQGLQPPRGRLSRDE